MRLMIVSSLAGNSHSLSNDSFGSISKFKFLVEENLRIESSWSGRELLSSWIILRFSQ